MAIFPSSALQYTFSLAHQWTTI